jgi:hypothetical protein
MSVNLECSRRRMIGYASKIYDQTALSRRHFAQFLVCIAMNKAFSARAMGKPAAGRRPVIMLQKSQILYLYLQMALILGGKPIKRANRYIIHCGKKATLVTKSLNDSILALDDSFERSL